MSAAFSRREAAAVSVVRSRSERCETRGTVIRGTGSRFQLRSNRSRSERTTLKTRALRERNTSHHTGHGPEPFTKQSLGKYAPEPKVASAEERISGLGSNAPVQVSRG